MKGGQESVSLCPAGKPLERSSCFEQQSGKQMGGRGQHSPGQKPRSLLIIQRQKLDGIRCSIACHWITAGQHVTLGKGQPQSAEVAPAARAAQGSSQSTPGSAGWRHTAATQPVPRRWHVTASKPHLIASPREMEHHSLVCKFFFFFLLSDPQPTY